MKILDKTGWCIGRWPDQPGSLMGACFICTHQKPIYFLMDENPDAGSSQALPLCAECGVEQMVRNWPHLGFQNGIPVITYDHIPHLVNLQNHHNRIKHLLDPKDGPQETYGRSN